MASKADNAARIDKTKREVAKALKTVEGLKSQRTEATEEISSIRARMVTLGIPKKAFDMALAYKMMDEDKRRGLDAGYALAREAVGLPFDAQGELFIPEEDEEGEKGEGEQTAFH